MAIKVGCCGRPVAQAKYFEALSLALAAALSSTVVLFQCPASFTPTRRHKANLQALFEKVEPGGLAFAWQPRGEWAKKL